MTQPSSPTSPQDPPSGPASLLAPRAGMCSLFAIPVGRWTMAEFVEGVSGVAKTGLPATGGSGVARARPAIIGYLNAHTANLAQASDRYRELLVASATCYADGMSVVWASRWIHGAAQGLPERVNAGDFLPLFARACEAAGIRVFLLGSAPGVARACAARLTAEVPGLQIVGASDGFWGRGGEFDSEAAMTAAVAAARPDVVLVGMGSPLQEELAHRAGAAWGAGVVWCVGALFEYYAGMRSRAPVWMRRLGLEWIWRLVLEPRRMAKRYLWGNLVLWATPFGNGDGCGGRGSEAVRG